MTFQDCTGLENMEECIQILQQHEWNLIVRLNCLFFPYLNRCDFQEAIRAVHEGIGDGNDHESTVPVYQTIDDQMVLTGRNPNNTRQPNSNDSDDVEIIGTVSAGASSQISTDSGNFLRLVKSTLLFFLARNLHFQIQYHDQTEHVHISENETVRM